MPEFDQLLAAAYILSGATKPSHASKDIQDVLSERLDQARRTLDVSVSSKSTDNVSLERGTALFSLNVLEQVQYILDNDQGRSHCHYCCSSGRFIDPLSSLGRLIGTRDLAQLRTLLSIVFKWLIEPEYDAICANVPLGGAEHVNIGASVHSVLLSGVARFWSFVFRPQPDVSSLPSPSTSMQAAARSHITQTLLSRHLADLLRPSLLLLSISPAAPVINEVDSIAYIRTSVDSLLDL